MQHTSIDNIYKDILLLSNSDRNKLYNRMQKDFYQDSEVVAYTTAGQPLTEKQYIAKIEKAIDQANRGELITDDELLNEVETW